MRLTALSRAFPLIVLAALAGCSALVAPEEAPAGEPVELRRLRPEPYPFAHYSGFRSPERMVVKDEASWRLAWQRMHEGQSPVPAVPEVDFTREMVVLVALGQRSSGGYSILLEGAYANAGRVDVVVRSTSPGARCFTTAALTQPVDVAVMPRSAAPVRFLERSAVHHCP